MQKVILCAFHFSPLAPTLVTIIGPEQKAFVSGRLLQDVHYNLIAEILNPQYSAIRDGNYKYHRMAFDNFANDQIGARKKITEVITSLRKIYNLNPNSPMLSSFFEAKALEITSVYQKAPMNEKQAILKVLRDIDAINMDKYNRMLKGK